MFFLANTFNHGPFGRAGARSQALIDALLGGIVLTLLLFPTLFSLPTPLYDHQLFGLSLILVSAASFAAVLRLIPLSSDPLPYVNLAVAFSIVFCAELSGKEGYTSSTVPYLLLAPLSFLAVRAVSLAGRTDWV